MRILRSVTRRGYTVQSAGFFNVVSPNRWFAASQFPPGLDAHVKVTDTADEARDRTDSEEVPQILISRTQDRSLARFVLAALAAAAVALFVLWWFFHTALGWSLDKNIL